MSRSEHNPKPKHYEWWNRRPLNCHYPSAENKRICHSIERARSKQELVKEMDELNTVDDGLYIKGRMDEYFQPDSQDALDTFEAMSDPNAGTSYLRFLHYTLMLHGY